MLDFDMGKYAAFVWPAWGATALVFAALAIRAFVSNRRWKTELARLQAKKAVK